MAANPIALCELCGGLGRVHVMRKQTRTRPDGTTQEYEAPVGMEPCECLLEARIRWAVSKAGIPPTLSASTFANFKAANESQLLALQGMARFSSHWLTDFPETAPQRSMMLVGSCGVGKSHLSAAALSSMIRLYGVKGMWLNMRSYLDELKNAYTRNAPSDITQRVIDVDVLVLDDLGATRKTDFSEEMTAQVIEARHQRHMSTIFSTNLVFGPAMPLDNEPDDVVTLFNPSPRKRRAETLGDRVGSRTYSRLVEMCRVFTIEGPDYRQSRGRA
jgi:DNA replication protein DnaC